jgi:hypothetical protein
LNGATAALGNEKIETTGSTATGLAPVPRWAKEHIADASKTIATNTFLLE